MDPVTWSRTWLWSHSLGQNDASEAAPAVNKYDQMSTVEFWSLNKFTWSKKKKTNTHIVLSEKTNFNDLY